METQDNNRNEDRNTIPNDRPAGSKDEREKANNGDWEDQRDEKDNEGYDADRNDNTGGAGSTGSAATSS